jgi:hypothetical protein
MAYVYKILRKEHETLKRARFRYLVKQGMSRATIARIIKVNRIIVFK